MSKMTMIYEGDLLVRAWHELSGTELTTDAPPDNQGKGRSFSPTDLMATSLAACMATIMGIVAKKYEIDLSGMCFSVIKEMTSKPVRRIGQLTVDFEMPAGISEEDRTCLIEAVKACPVCQSIHPDVKVQVNYNWG